MKVLKVSPKQTLFTGSTESCVLVPNQWLQWVRRSELSALKAPVLDAIGISLSIVCLRWPACKDLIRWDPHAYWLLQMGAYPG